MKMKFYHGFKKMTTADFTWGKLQNKRAFVGASDDWNRRRTERNQGMREKFRSFHDAEGKKSISALAQESTRNLSGSSPKGLEQLYTILVDMKRDIKKVAQANCIKSAEAYAEKLSKRTGMTHSAEMHDLNGDNIPEVIVRDVYGNPVVINGYTTTNSTWPERLQYYNTRKDTELRGKNGKPIKESLQAWRAREFQTQYGEGAEILDLKKFEPPEWAKKAYKAGYRSFPRRPKSGKRSAYKAVQEALIKPVWNTLVEEDGRIPKKYYLTASAFTWNFLFLSKAMLDVYGDEAFDWCVHMFKSGSDADQSDINAFNKLKGQSEVKAALENLVITIASSDTEKIDSVGNLVQRVLRLGARYTLNGRDANEYDGALMRRNILILEGILDGTETVAAESPSEIREVMGGDEQGDAGDDDVVVVEE